MGSSGMLQRSEKQKGKGHGKNVRKGQKVQEGYHGSSEGLPGSR